MYTLDLFCGGGGSSYGAQHAGAEIVGGVDLWPLATEVFNDNFPNAHVINSRIEELSTKQIRKHYGGIDLLLASPECTNHSCAKGNKPRSEISKETAIQALRFTKILKPRWVVLENVINMRPWSRYGELIENLKDQGYNVSEQVLDATDFGVAQKRRRLFVICDRENHVPLLRPNRRKRRVASDVVDMAGPWKMAPLIADGRAQATLERARNGFANVGRNRPFLIVYYGSDGAGGWQRLDDPLRTITTLDRFALVTPSHNGRKHMMRMLQVPELKKAMGLDSGYRLEKGTRRDKIKILGNGVCPPVMEAIIKMLRDNQL